MGNNADALRRLQHRVDHHGNAPAPVPPRPARTPVPFMDLPGASDYIATNGYPSNAARSPYQQPAMPARMHL
jgi:E3 SUMO-protein ligase PIAS1